MEELDRDAGIVYLQAALFGHVKSGVVLGLAICKFLIGHSLAETVRFSPSIGIHPIR